MFKLNIDVPFVHESVCMAYNHPSVKPDRCKHLFGQTIHYWLVYSPSSDKPLGIDPGLVE